MPEPTNILRSELPAVAGYKWERVYLPATVAAITYDESTSQFVTLGSASLFGSDPFSMLNAGSLGGAWYSVATNGSIGVALQNSTGGSFTSAINTNIAGRSSWQPGAAIPAGGYSHTLYFNGRFFGFGGSNGGANGALYVSSADGMSWTTHYIPQAFATFYSAVVAFGKIYVYTTNGISVSEDGFNWSTTSEWNLGGTWRLIANDSTLVAVKHSTVAPYVAMVSHDGESFQQVELPTAYAASVVFEASGMLVVFDTQASTRNTLVSSDGLNWKVASPRPIANSQVATSTGGYVLNVSQSTTTDHLISNATGIPIKHTVAMDSVMTSLHISAKSSARVWLDIDNVPLLYGESISMNSSKFIDVSQPIKQGSVIEIWADSPGVHASLDGILI